MMMKKIKQTLSLLFAALLLVSCTKTEDGKMPPYDGKILNMHLNLTNGSIGLSTVELQTVRILVFSEGTKVLDQQFSTPTTDDPTYQLDVASGFNNFYVFCNPTEEINTKIADISSEADVENISFEATSFVSNNAPNLPMYGKLDGVWVDKNSDGATTVTIEGVTTPDLTIPVDRLMVGLRMTVIKNTSTQDQEFTIKSMSYTIHRIPKYMYIGKDKPYTESTYQAEIMNNGVGTLLIDGEYDKTQNPYTVSKGDYITFPDVYLPEHILTDKADVDLCTYMTITANCVLEGTNVEVSSVYTVDLGTRLPANLNLNRNYYYNLFVTIKHLGSMGFYAEILPLVEYNTPITWKPFEGYTIVSEKTESYGLDENIWNDYFQYYGILKVTRKNTSTNKSLVYPALFRYGSVIALADRNAAGAFKSTLFNPVNNTSGDLLYYPTATTAPANWSSVGSIVSGDVGDAEHTLDNIKQGKGDPCRLVGISNDQIAAGTVDNKLWRMATEEQMQWLITARDESGPYSSNGYHSFGSAIQLTPKTFGKRIAVDGSMSLVPGAGSYWSSNAAKLFSFTTINNNPLLAVGDPEEAHAVRCVRTDIPPSRFGIFGIQVPYTGGTFDWDNIFYSPDKVYNVPFWKITRWDDRDGLNFLKTSGYYHNAQDYEIPKFTIPELTDVYEGKTYDVNIEGYGLDGQAHSILTTIRQEIKVHNLKLNRNLTDRIPAEGATITFSLSISPEPIQKHAPGGSQPYSDMKWYVIAKRVAPSGTFFINSPVVTALNSTSITIPANDSNEEIGVIFLFQSPGPFISYRWSNDPNGSGTFSYVQNKK